jgi:sugar O-acyltransferase (sialic acid O-acetyltransferase NeuD family)
MRRKAVIFGTGSLGQVVDFYLSRDSEYEVVGFTSSGDATLSEEAFGRPLVGFDDVAGRFPPAEHDMFIAVGYRNLNQLRERFCSEARTKGYRLLSYVSSKATWWNDTLLGDNILILEDNTIQPFVVIGDGTLLWSGNHIGHHSRVGAYCFVTSQVVVSGHCTIGDRCFLGVNATVVDETMIADDNIIGPGTLIQKNTSPRDVFVAERTKKFPKDSTRFFR